MVINDHQIPLSLDTLLQKGKWAKPSTSRLVARYLGIRRKRVSEFLLCDLQGMIALTDQLLDLSHESEDTRGLYKVWPSHAKETPLVGWLDANKAVVIGYSPGYEDNLVLDYASSPACVRYFPDESENAEWILVSRSYDNLLQGLKDKYWGLAALLF